MRITRKSVDPITFSETFSMASTLEDSLVDEATSQDKTSISKQPQTTPKKERRFSDEVEVFIIPPIEKDQYDLLFYTDEEIANFRHEAFMDECGLSNEDFDFDIQTDL